MAMGTPLPQMARLWPTTSYVYDADGMRLERIVNGQVSSYLMDPLGGYGNVVEERAGFTGNLVARYDSGLDLIRMDRGGVASYYVQDGLGSVVALTNTAGLVTDSYGYDAFGNPERLSGTTGNPFLFNGQQYDEAEGLYYLRARYYAPGQGRFITHDPLMGSEGDPQSLHRYLYAHADPVNNIDPTGMETIPEFLLAAAIAIKNFDTKEFAKSVLFGSIGGAVASGGRARILESSVEEVQHEAFIGAAFGAAFGALGYISKIMPSETIARIMCSLGKVGLLFGAGLIAHDLGNYLGHEVEGNSQDAIKWRNTTLWDTAWYLLSFGSANIGCFTAESNVEFYANGVLHTGNIGDLVHLYDSGAKISVISRDEKTGNDELCEVNNTSKRLVNDTITVEFADKITGRIVESISGTSEHPFMTSEGWIAMGDLKIGTEILTRAGPCLIVASIKNNHYLNGVYVYNFTVDKKHTYFVGGLYGGIWVHNDGTNCFKDRKFEIDIDHIVDHHHPTLGNTARQRIEAWKAAKAAGKKIREDRTFFHDMSPEEIFGAVQRAASNFRARKEVRKQWNVLEGGEHDGAQRVLYQSFDSKSGLKIEYWFNRSTKRIESAYPIWD
jgi:RHS repeat-associated protein